uniref:Uncharacterized protein n=1 Tax=Rhizophora mucronata TaxID=61149 RepID=A0A2P2NTH0_RHIMU
MLTDICSLGAWIPSRNTWTHCLRFLQLSEA